MFTGLIDDIGTIESVTSTGAGLEFRIRCRYTDIAVGESIAVNGVCLTVLECSHLWFTVAAMTTTLDRTMLGRWSAGHKVNLERALRASDRLGGHIVQGHVDGLGTVVDTRTDGSAWLVDIEIPADMFELMVPHGSVALDGVSLTVNDMPRENVIQVSLIEYTRMHTTLGAFSAGVHAHIEGDVIGKYVRRIATPYTSIQI
jgi:riboflavin synthase